MTRQQALDWLADIQRKQRECAPLGGLESLDATCTCLVTREAFARAERKDGSPVKGATISKQPALLARYSWEKRLAPYWLLVTNAPFDEIVKALAEPAPRQITEPS